MNAIEKALATKAAELKGASRALSLATTPGRQTAEEVRADVKTAAELIAFELDDLIALTLKGERQGSRAYEAAAELARADVTGKGARISEALKS